MPSLKSSKLHKIILIGASTGGPGHIKKILSSLAGELEASIIIAQHMGKEFIPSFTQQLNSNCRYKVAEVKQDMPLSPSTIYICNLKTAIEISNNRLFFSLNKTQPSGYNPDINHLLSSVAKIADNIKVLGVILTGIGNDGASGCKQVFTQGGQCIAESESSTIVNGMPLQAKKLNENIEVLSLEKIIKRINSWGV